jgi:NAD+ synthase (glutamine-hydrolysing)
VKAKILMRYFLLPVIFGVCFLPRSFAATNECRDVFNDHVIGQMRVAMCQTNPTLGDFDYNLRRIKSFLVRAGEEKATVAILPEMALSGYSVKDLLERNDFIDANDQALQNLLAFLRETPQLPERVVIGTFVRNENRSGRNLQNVALIVENGNIVYSQVKKLLPNYDVFDDMRYFEPGTRTTPALKTAAGKIKCVVCEDSWGRDRVDGRILYKTDPALKARDSDVVINLSASPYTTTKHKLRREVIGGFAQRVQAPVIYVNQMGAYDDVLFDGRSMIFAKSGAVLFEMPAFTESMGIVDFNSKSESITSPPKILNWNSSNRTWVAHLKKDRPSDKVILERALVAGIREHFVHVGYARAVIGLSGGIDSTLVATLAVQALGAENVIGVAMPSRYSSDGSVKDARYLAEKLGIKFVVHPIEVGVATAESGLSQSYDKLKDAFSIADDDTTSDNVQARLRGLILNSIANKFDALVLVTSNKSEMAVGQTTTFGDMAGALAPIGDLYKTEVYSLAKSIDGRLRVMPADVFTKPASAELAPGQSDEAKFGEWSKLDVVLAMYLEQHKSEPEIVAAGFAPDYVHRTLGYVRTNEFKRRLATIILKVTPEAFGSGRRIPVSAYFRPVQEK